MIKFNYYVLLFSIVILCSGIFYLTPKFYKNIMKKIMKYIVHLIIKQKQGIISSIKHGNFVGKGHRNFEGYVLNFSFIGFIVLVSICLLSSLDFILTSIYHFVFNELIKVLILTWYIQ